MKMDLIYITNNSEHIGVADRAGVDRIMIDLELLGKEKRQGHLNTVISKHSIEDISRARKIIKDAELMVRINPVNPTSAAEINEVIRAGADIIMLPMFRTKREVARFLELVDGRVKTSLLMETPEALASGEQILSLGGIGEVHLGLNDLHLALGLTFMFELLASGVGDDFALLCKSKNIKFGFGGVARLHSGDLPATGILSEHVRLGSSQVILSRDFHTLFTECKLSESEQAFKEEVGKIRNYLVEASDFDHKKLHDNKQEVADKVAQIAKTISSKRID